MTLLEWRTSLVLGVEAMDREHRELVAAMNQIHALDQQGAKKPTIDAAILRLVELTRRHFADEERYMESIDFPDRKMHARIHADMLRQVGEHYAAFRAGDGRVAKKFFDFLVLWLGAHITGIDRKYATAPTPAR